MDSRICQTSTVTPAEPGVFPLFDKILRVIAVDARQAFAVSRLCGEDVS